MNDLFSKLLLTIAGALLVPDLLLLLGFSLFCLANLGGICAEALTRTRYHGAFAVFIRQLRRDSDRVPCLDQVPAAFGIPRLAFCELRDFDSDPHKLLDDLQLDADKALGRLHMGIRLGPMLGLVGTLIPLGPALKALAAGDTKTLAESLTIAFATPVVGMLIGGLSYAMHSVRSRWYTHDLNDVEYLFRRLMPLQMNAAAVVSENARTEHKPAIKPKIKPSTSKVLTCENYAR